MQLAELFAVSARPATAQSWEFHSHLLAAPLICPRPARIALMGPDRCGKTSFLFHLAYSYAQASRTVLLLSARSRLEESQPVLPRDAEPADEEWGHVHIKFVEDADGLIEFCACIHLLQGDVPSLILVDNLPFLVKATGARATVAPTAGASGPTQMLAFDKCLMASLAHLEEAARQCHAKARSPCDLVVTLDAIKGVPQFSYVINRWLPITLNIKRTAAGTFVMGQLVHGELSSEHAAVEFVFSRATESKSYIRYEFVVPARYIASRQPRVTASAPALHCPQNHGRGDGEGGRGGAVSRAVRERPGARARHVRRTRVAVLSVSRVYTHRTASRAVEAASTRCCVRGPPRALARRPLAMSRAPRKARPGLQGTPGVPP